MAWDIYGNKLEPGYCEVHPSVPEEYPCFVCREIEKSDRERREYNEARKAEWEYSEEQEYYESLAKKDIDYQIAVKIVKIVSYLLRKAEVYKDKIRAKIINRIQS